MTPRVSHLLESSLYVADVDRSVVFYQRVFGFELLLTEPRVAALAVPGGSVLLLFRQSGSTEPRVVAGAVIPGHDACGSQHLCFAVPLVGLAEWSAHLAACGVAIESRVGPEIFGGTSLYFRDPDGHLLEVAGPGLWQVF